MLKKAYAGIGSRKTPVELKPLIQQISSFLEEEGYMLRSGGADGADSFFEENITNKEIYLPCKGFNNNPSMRYDVSKEAYGLARQFHPHWNKLNFFAKKLIARNGYQVLGHNLETPVYFIVCWTENGEIKGGTGQALRIAEHYNIPVCNLFFVKSFERFLEFYNFVLNKKQSNEKK